MRVTILAAVIISLLSLLLYAQQPAPMGADTAKQMEKPETAKELKKPEKMTEPTAAGEMEEMKETKGMEAPAAMAADLTLKDMAFCADVVDREPVSTDSTFSADIGKIYCWSNVLNDGGEAFIEHVWYYNGDEMARVTLPAKYSRNRIWSSKNILPEWTGKWTVMIMAGSEKLGEMSCTVE